MDGEEVLAREADLALDNRSTHLKSLVCRIVIVVLLWRMSMDAVDGRR